MSATVTRVSGNAGDPHGIAVELEGLSPRYIVHVVTGPGGPRLRSLQIDAEEITPDVLRATPTLRIARAAAQFAASMDGTASLAEPSGPALRGKGHKLSSEHYLRVASWVTSARAAGLPIRRTVADNLGVSLATVDRWIRGAKDLGYLEEGHL